MQLRTSGSPVRCWWALIIPGVTTHPVASMTSARGRSRKQLARRADRLDHAVDGKHGAAAQHLPRRVHRDDVTVGDDQLHRRTVVAWPSASTR